MEVEDNTDDCIGVESNSIKVISQITCEAFDFCNDSISIRFKNHQKVSHLKFPLKISSYYSLQFYFRTKTP